MKHGLGVRLELAIWMVRKYDLAFGEVLPGLLKPIGFFLCRQIGCHLAQRNRKCYQDRRHGRPPLWGEAERGGNYKTFCLDFNGSFRQHWFSDCADHELRSNSALMHDERWRRSMVVL